MIVYASNGPIHLPELTQLARSTNHSSSIVNEPYAVRRCPSTSHSFASTRASHGQSSVADRSRRDQRQRAGQRPRARP